MQSAGTRAGVCTTGSRRLLGLCIVAALSSICRGRRGQGRWWQRVGHVAMQLNRQSCDSHTFYSHMRVIESMR